MFLSSSLPPLYAQASTANLNPFPVYLGQPPSYSSSQRSASGFLWGASTYGEALTAEQASVLVADAELSTTISYIK